MPCKRSSQLSYIPTSTGDGWITILPAKQVCPTKLVIPPGRFLSVFQTATLGLKNWLGIILTD
jgi:hypothetical protein